MDALAVVFVLAFGALVIFCLGILYGTYSERLAWKTRADTSCAHHCDGQFYYVYSEPHFNENYALKPFPKEPSQWPIFPG
jgi:hypothetical protein